MGKKNFLKSSLTIAAAATVMSTLAPMSTVKAATTPQPTLTYSAHVAKYAWMGSVTATGDENTPIAGTVGESKLADAFKIDLQGIEGVELEYSVHNRTIGWSDWMTEGEVAGYVQPDDKFSSGNILDWKQAEAIKIRVSKGLDKLKAAGYEIRYRVHLGYDGWEKEWTVADDSTVVINQRTTNSQTGKDANGNKVIAGSVGWSRRIEALQVMLVKTEPEVHYEYNFAVNSNNVINDTNSSTSKINITLPSGRVEEDTTFDLYYVNSKEVDTKISASNLIVKQYANESGEVSVNFTNYMNTFASSNTESKVTLKLKKKGSTETVAQTEVIVNRIHPEAVKVSARRDGTQNAALKFESRADSDIVKVHYIISNSTNVQNVDSTTNLMDKTKHKDLKTVTVENNKFDNKLDWTELENSTESKKKYTPYKIYFVVENAMGNLSKNVLSVVVPNDTNGKIESKVTNVSVNNSLKATWTIPNEQPTNGYTVTVYDEDGKVIGEKKVAEGDKTSASLTDIVKKPGKYTLTVTSNGAVDGTSSASEETEPVEFEVTQLEKVTGLEFVTDDETGNVKLKWDEYADKDNAAFSGYTIKISKYNPTKGTYEDTKTQNNVGKNLTELKLSEISTFTADVNNRYKAEITANRSSSYAKVLASETTETTKDYLKLSVTTTPTALSDTKMQLDFSEMNTIEKLGNEITYDVEVWKKVESDTAEKHYELVDTREDVAKDENGKIFVDKLDPETAYKFVLVVHVDGDDAEGRSALSKETKTLRTLPSIDGLMVTKIKPTSASVGKGKIYTELAGYDIWIDGIEITSDNKSEFYDPNNLLDESSYIKTLVKSLNEGDIIISLTKEKVTIKAANVATNGKNRIINVGSDRVLEIQGNVCQQDIRIGTNEAKEVILTGEGALFKISNFTSMAPVKVSDGVKLVSDIKETDAHKISVTILANATATLNGIDISSSGDLEVSEESMIKSEHTLKIKSAGNNTININNNSQKKLKVTFMDGAQAGDYQLGKITINSNAEVVVNSGGTLKADMSITTENANIDITDSNLIGAKDVKVSANKNSSAITIKANTTSIFPNITNNNKAITIMNYTLDQLKTLRDKGTTITGSNLTKAMVQNLSDEQLQKIVDYFNAFGSKLQAFGKATVNKDTSEDKVIITIPKNSELSLTEIKGLK